MTDILSMINRLQDTAIDFTLSGRERDRDELHAARRAIMEAFEARVKPLEWELIDDDWWGATALDCLSYEVRQARASVRVRFPLSRSFEVFDGTVDEAKAAAQADLETRIRAAIHPSLEQE